LKICRKQKKTGKEEKKHERPGRTEQKKAPEKDVRGPGQRNGQTSSTTSKEGPVKGLRGRVHPGGAAGSTRNRGKVFKGIYKKKKVRSNQKLTEERTQETYEFMKKKIQTPLTGVRKKK